MIELRNVFKSYKTRIGHNVILNHVSLAFPEMTGVGILGRNGAGKSTLLRLLAGVEAPDSGEIIRGSRLSFPIGFGGGFTSSLSAEENCRFVARIYGENPDRVVGYTKAFAELGDYFFMPMSTYSSGMRSRVAFGLSMAIDFDYYLVDEVTAVGDASFKQKCFEAFRARRERSAVIMVSHSMSTIKQYCTTCAILEKGRLTLYRSTADAERAYKLLMDQRQQRRLRRKPSRVRSV